MKKLLKEKAQEIFDSVMENTTFPSNVKVSRKNKTWILSVSLKNSFGETGEFIYRPKTEALEKHLNQLKKMNDVFEGEIGIVEEIKENLAGAVCEGLLNTFHIEIEEAFQNFHKTAAFLMNQVMSKSLDQFSKFHPIQKDVDSEQDFPELANKSKIDVRNFIKERHANVLNLVEHIGTLNYAEGLHGPHKRLIGYFYSNLLSDWKEAKRLYKQNKHLDNWNQLIIVAFPYLPQDLITRLDNSDPYLSMPSAIALENSARMCGFYNNSLNLRNLQLYLKDSRKWIQECGEDEVVKESEKFMNYKFEEVKIKIKAFKSVNKEIDFSDFPLIHQLVYEMLLYSENEVPQENSEKQ